FHRRSGMLSSQEIDAHIQSIAAALDALSAGGGNLSGCMEIDERFGALREQYRQQPDSLAGRVQRLSELSRRFDDLLADRLTRVVDRFHEVNEQIRLGEQEKAFWRSFLIRTATQARQEYLNGTAATVHVRSIRSRTLPPAGGSTRARLEDLVRQSGCWEQVSQLSRTRLERALAGKVFARPQAEAIEQLCPATIVHQVSSRAAEG
ncbi:MAG: hypothetical protein ACE5I3_12355, partial [Phycisphaerae bacterium]